MHCLNRWFCIHLFVLLNVWKPTETSKSGDRITEAFGSEAKGSLKGFHDHLWQVKHLLVTFFRTCRPHRFPKAFFGWVSPSRISACSILLCSLSAINFGKTLPHGKIIGCFSYSPRSAFCWWPLSRNILSSCLSGTKRLLKWCPSMFFFSKFRSSSSGNPDGLSSFQFSWL